MRVRGAVGGKEIAGAEYRRVPERRSYLSEGAGDSGAALAGRMFRGRLPLARRDRAGGEAAEAGESSLGRISGGQQLRHPRIYGAVQADRGGAVYRGQCRQRESGGT